MEKIQMMKIKSDLCTIKYYFINYNFLYFFYCYILSKF